MKRIDNGNTIDSLKPAQYGAPLTYIEGSSSYDGALIKDLQAKVDAFNEELTQIANDLNNYRMNSAVEFSTGTLGALNGTIENLVSVASVIRNLEATTADIPNLTSAIVTIDDLSADLARLDEIRSHLVTADSVSADEAVIDALTVTDLIVQGTQTFVNLNAINVSSDSITSSEGRIDSLESQSVQTDTLESDTVNATDLNVQTASVSKIQTIEEIVKTADINEITHKYNKIEPENTEHYIIEVPYFQNGQYRLIGINAAGVAKASMDIRNDISNIWLSWSYNRTFDDRWLEELDIYDYNSQRPQIYIKVNENGDKLTWYWQSNCHDSAGPIKTWSDWPHYTEAGNWHYRFLHTEGVFFSHAVDIMSNSGEHDYASLILYPKTDWEDTEDETIEFNGMIDTEFKLYRPDQEVNTDSDVVHNKLESTDTTKLNSHFFIGTEEEWNTVKSGMKNDSLVFIGE